MAFKPIDKSEKIVPGVKYRSTYTWRVPFTPTLSNMMFNAINAARGPLGVAGIAVDSIIVSPPNLTPQAPGSRYSAWRILIHWHRKV
jgi:hypothetical protein